MEKITRHILFFDESVKESSYAQELKKSIESMNKKYGFSSTIEMIEIDEDSKKDMERIAKAFQGDRRELFLNGAGADTALFTVLSSIVLRNNGQVIAYDKEENSYNLITKNGFINKKIEKNMNIEDFLILMGETLLEEHSKEKILAQKEELLLLFGNAPRMFKIRYMLKKRKTKELKKRYPDVMEALKVLKIVDEHYLMRGQEAFVNFGYLFEAFVFLRLEAFDFDDVKVGVKIRFDEQQVSYRNIEVVNEFDILTINNNKIGFIECKMGDSLDPLGTVYKSDSIMDYFGESASSLIVNIQRDATPHEKRSKKNFGEALTLRAKTKRVNIFNNFELGKNKFRTKVLEAFDVELKPEYKKESINKLLDKWNS